MNRAPTGGSASPVQEVLARVLDQAQEVLAQQPVEAAPGFADGWRVEFFWKRGAAGRRAYFQYRRGRGKDRKTVYGGSIAVACERHPERVKAFLARTDFLPINLPKEWLTWAKEEAEDGPVTVLALHDVRLERGKDGYRLALVDGASTGTPSTGKDGE